MSDDFGDPTEPFVLSREQVIEYLIEHLIGQVCPLNMPWAGPDYDNDHGHTHCYFLGTAIVMLREDATT